MTVGVSTDLPTPPHDQDVTQGQFFKQSLTFQSFPSPGPYGIWHLPKRG